jgi:iron complex outermembrane receptor protein
MLPSPDRRLTAAALAALAAAVATSAGVARGAEERVDMTSVDIESLLDLSVQAVTRRVERASEAPATVFVITADDIRRQGFRTLAEVLSSVPGLYSYVGNLRQIGVRGMGFGSDFTTRMLVLIDGHPITNAVGTDVSHGVPVPLDAVRRVEVIKGPVGAVYGPSAFFGVVNLVTGGGDPGGTAWAGVQAGQEQVRAAEGAAAWRGRAGPVDLVAAASGFGSRGFDYRFPEVVGTPGAPADGVARGMDSGRAQTGYLRAAWGGLTGSAACGHARDGLPGVVPSDSRSALETLTCFAELSEQLRPTSDLTLALRLAGDAFEARAGRALPEPPLGVGLFVDEGHDRWATAEARADWRPVRALRLDVGATGKLHEIFHASSASAAPALDARLNREFTELNGWASAEAKVAGTLTLHGGVTWYTHSLFGSQLTPKAAAVWQPSRDDSAKAIWSTGFRPPAFVEAFFSDNLAYVANPALRPEKVSSTEVAYEHRFGGIASAGLSLFWDRYRDLIVQQTVPAPGLVGPPASAADFRQIAVNDPGHLDLMGAELALTLRHRDLFQAYGGVSVQRLDVPGRPEFPGVAANLALSTRWPWRPALLSARGTWLGARTATPRVGVDAPRLRASGTVSALAALDVPGVRGLQLELAVLNILDAQNPSPAPPGRGAVLRIPDAPRTLRADLRWSF